MEQGSRGVFSGDQKTEQPWGFSGEQKTGQPWGFSGEQKTGQPWSVFLESRKQRWAGVIFPGAENLQQQFLLQQNSQICMQIG